MKLVREHINFEKPESEEDFRNSLFDKKILVSDFHHGGRGGIHIIFKDNEYLEFFMRYNENKEEFFVIDSLFTAELIYNLKKNNILFFDKNTINGRIISFSEKNVDWGEFEKPLKEN